MRWLLASMFSFLLLSSCGGGWQARQTLGQDVDGARYSTGWLFGGPTIYVYPSGTIHRRYEGGTKDMRVGQKFTYIDKELWQQIKTIVAEQGGERLLDSSNNEDAVCDGGYEYLYIKVGGKNAYFVLDGMDCDVAIEKHDAAGRKAVEIFRELAKRFQRKAS